MAIDPKFKSKELPTVTYDIGRAKIHEFAKAIKADPNKYNDIAPPTFPVVYASSLLEAVLYDKEMNLNLQKLVHGEQIFNYLKAVRPGDTITSTGQIVDIFSKGPHDFISYQVDSSNQNGEKVCEQKWILIVRGGNDKDFTLQEKLMMKIASMTPQSNKAFANGFDDSVKFSKNEFGQDTMSVPIDKYRPQKYAGASGDFNAIHLDNDLGKSVGLGGYILHGMATMGFGANFALRNRSPEDIKSYKVRFSAPVKPFDILTYTVISEDGKHIKFSAKNQNNQDVLSSCTMEFN